MNMKFRYFLAYVVCHILLINSPTICQNTITTSTTTTTVKSHFSFSTTATTDIAKSILSSALSSVSSTHGVVPSQKSQTATSLVTAKISNTISTVSNGSTYSPPIALQTSKASSILMQTIISTPSIPNSNYTSTPIFSQAVSNNSSNLLTNTVKSSLTDRTVSTSATSGLTKILSASLLKTSVIVSSSSNTASSNVTLLSSESMSRTITRSSIQTSAVTNNDSSTSTISSESISQRTSITSNISTPVSNKTVSTPVSNKTVSTPVSNKTVSTPVSNETVSASVSNKIIITSSIISFSTESSNILSSSSSKIPLSPSPSFKVIIVSTYVPCFVTYLWNYTTMNTNIISKTKSSSSIKHVNQTVYQNITTAVMISSSAGISWTQLSSTKLQISSSFSLSPSNSRNSISHSTPLLTRSSFLWTSSVDNTSIVSSNVSSMKISPSSEKTTTVSLNTMSVSPSSSGNIERSNFTVSAVGKRRRRREVDSKNTTVSSVASSFMTIKSVITMPQVSTVSSAAMLSTPVTLESMKTNAIYSLLSSQSSLVSGKVMKSSINIVVANSSGIAASQSFHLTTLSVNATKSLSSYLTTQESRVIQTSYPTLDKTTTAIISSIFQSVTTSTVRSYNKASTRSVVSSWSRSLLSSVSSTFPLDVHSSNQLISPSMRTIILSNKSTQLVSTASATRTSLIVTPSLYTVSTVTITVSLSNKSTQSVSNASITGTPLIVTPSLNTVSTVTITVSLSNKSTQSVSNASITGTPLIVTPSLNTVSTMIVTVSLSNKSTQSVSNASITVTPLIVTPSSNTVSTITGTTTSSKGTQSVSVASTTGRPFIVMSSLNTVSTATVKNLKSTASRLSSEVSKDNSTSIPVYTSTLSLCLTVYSTLVPILSTVSGIFSSTTGIIFSKVIHSTISTDAVHNYTNMYSSSTVTSALHTLMLSSTAEKGSLTVNVPTYTHTYHPSLSTHMEQSTNSHVLNRSQVKLSSYSSVIQNSTIFTVTDKRQTLQTVITKSVTSTQTFISGSKATAQTVVPRSEDTTATSVYNSMLISASTPDTVFLKTLKTSVVVTTTQSSGGSLFLQTVSRNKQTVTINVSIHHTSSSGTSTSEIHPSPSTKSHQSSSMSSISVSPTASEFVVTTATLRPTTTAIPINNNIKIMMNVHPSVDVNSPAFKNNLEKKLVDTYVSLKFMRKRRAVSNGNTTVDVINAVRKQGSIVDVEFKVQENGVNVPADEAAGVFNYLSRTGLQKRLGYEVLAPVETVVASKPYSTENVLGMVVEDNANMNISNATVQAEFEVKLAEYYKVGRNTSYPVTMEIIYLKHEQGGIVYIECYFVENGVVQNATYIASFFANKTVTDLTTAVELQVSSLPYVVNKQIPTIPDYIVKMVIKPLVATDVTTSSYQESIALKISEIYLSGKHKNRKRRAVSSVFTQVSLIMPVNADQADITFVTSDRGIVQSGQTTADTMNKLSAAEMQAILNAEVISKPAPVVKAIPAATSDPPYWIIAAATVPVIVIVLLFCLVCWRWKKGGPQRKTSPEEINMVETKPVVSSRDTMETQETKMIREKTEIAVPLHATNNNVPQHNDELKASTRRKVRLNTNKPHGRQNQAYEEESEEENEDVEESEEETEEEEEVIIVRKSAAQQQQRKRDIEVKRRLEYEDRKEVPQKPPRTGPRTPVPSSRSPVMQQTRKPLELTGSMLEDDDNVKPVQTQNLSYSAGHVPTFGNMTETRGLTADTPVRFRRNIESMEDFSNPTGPLPLLDLKQTSLIAATPSMADPDLQHKAEVERIRNKQRQRDHIVGTSFSSSMHNSKPTERQWQREQDEIDAVLNPKHAEKVPNISTRKGRLRKRLRRKNKIYMAPAEGTKMKEDVLLKSFQQFSSPTKDSEPNKENSVESDAESELSMREASRRIHALLDDTFTTLKKYQKNLPKDESTEKPKIDSDSSFRSSTPRRYAGMRPALPGPAPAHGRATAIPPGVGKRREVAPNPYINPYTQFSPFAEPMVTWDPLERQRYINQRFGYPAYGPTASSLTMPYGMPGQNVYMTPIQQRPDGMGGMVWSPYVNEDAITNPAFNPAAMTIPGQNSVPPMRDDFKMAHTTTLDMDDLGALKKSTSSQPLIRAIKEELLKLSHSAQGKTRITELQQTATPSNR